MASTEIGTLAAEVEFVGVVDEPVQRCIGDGRVAKPVVPLRDRELAGDDRGAAVVALRLGR